LASAVVLPDEAVVSVFTASASTSRTRCWSWAGKALAAGDWVIADWNATSGARTKRFDAGWLVGERRVARGPPQLVK